ncbi:MAG: ClbS/DfsB family four-helix bundle protein [Anaerolineae bacterium]|nr:MAG: ClbS/DfsB family four-helix bundle protein [Anaerolineae bacterium]
MSEFVRAEWEARIQHGFEELLEFLESLPEGEWENGADAAGWTAKDHVAHLAVWAGSMVAVMNGRPRWEAMGLPLETWMTIVRTYDVINAAIRAAHWGDTPVQAFAAWRAAHAAVMARAAALPDEELRLPYSHYQPGATDETAPLYLYIEGNTSDHYAEHRAYIGVLLGR